MLEQTPRSVLLLGLPDPLPSDLRRALPQGWTIRSEPYVSGAPPIQDADVVFCVAESELYRALLEEIKRTGTGVPVVVVSRHPDVTDWLDAIEAGASDYCAPPFDRNQIRWILHAALDSRRLVA